MRPCFGPSLLDGSKRQPVLTHQVSGQAAPRGFGASAALFVRTGSSMVAKRGLPALFVGLAPRMAEKVGSAPNAHAPHRRPAPVGCIRLV
jgi:hypothetical protein